jgi:hypothetical protein
MGDQKSFGFPSENLSVLCGQRRADGSSLATRVACFRAHQLGRLAASVSPESRAV